MKTPFEKCYRGSIAAPPPYCPEIDDPPVSFDIECHQEKVFIAGGRRYRLFEFLKGNEGGNMRPCDCKLEEDLQCINERGIAFNEKSLYIKPPNVVLNIGPCEVKLPMNTFKRFAEWYLENQE
jgi:hypothetical protein